MSLDKRFDEFQREAVDAIQSDFFENRSGRYLLVIPTGGGKTFTAAKAINRLYETDVLNPKDQVLWVAHRDYLLQQAKDAFEKVSNNNNWQNRVRFQTIQKSSDCVADFSVKIIVIDEAHHAAAPSYQSFFSTGSKGVLGLTATPSRHDKKSLDFDRESFSIGFPDLIEKGLIISPKFISLDTDIQFEFNGFSDDDLNGLNIESRNQYILDHILENTGKYKKIAVFVGTKKHARDLFNLMNSNPQIKEVYNSISYVFGGDENSRGQIRSAFIEEEKAYARSIIINVDVLTEGYDDPSINTVIMARPTRSKLYYMQAVGRALRFNDDDAGKCAYIVEVTDRLPNIRYKIDNRWLFSEISDELEPAVHDLRYGSEDELKTVIAGLFSENKVFSEYEIIPNMGLPSRLGILLFKVFTASGDRYIPLILDKENRWDLVNIFNYISEHASLLAEHNYHYEEFFNNATHRCKTDLTISNTHKKFVCDAARNAYTALSSAVDDLPWVSYYSLRYKRPEESGILLEFLDGVVNADQLKEQVLSRQYVSGSVLIKLPLPLGNYVGKLVNEEEFDALKKVQEHLKRIKEEFGEEDHSSLVAKCLSDVKFPIEAKFHYAIVELVRTEEKYFLDLKEI